MPDARQRHDDLRGRGLRRHALLCLHQTRGEAQVVGDGMAVGQLRQPRGALLEERGRLRQAHARKTHMVEGLDFAGLEDALHRSSSLVRKRRYRPEAVSEGITGRLRKTRQELSPVILRYQPR